jgi:flotillin
MAKEIIFGQLRLTVASLTIEQINQDRESFLEAVRKNVEPELNKIGLYLINVNITDITDESDYIESIGKKAASEASTRPRWMWPSRPSSAPSAKPKPTGKETIRVAENMAEAEKGKKSALASQRIYVQQRESEAVQGENLPQVEIADSNAAMEVKRACPPARRGGQARSPEGHPDAAEYEKRRAQLRAEEVAQQEINKIKLEIDAEANAEMTRRRPAARRTPS